MYDNLLFNNIQAKCNLQSYDEHAKTISLTGILSALFSYSPATDHHSEHLKSENITKLLDSKNEKSTFYPSQSTFIPHQTK